MFIVLRISIHYDMFRLTWPFSGIIQYVQNIWEDFSNMMFCKNKRDLIFM
jgi:hypothetical protein